VVRGKQEERDQQARKRSCITEEHDAFGLVVRGQKLVVKEAMEEVPNEHLELGLFPPGGCGAGLNGERLNWVIGGGQETVSLRHDAPP
jgi:hypothetical protein